MRGRVHVLRIFYSFTTRYLSRNPREKKKTLLQSRVLIDFLLCLLSSAYGNTTKSPSPQHALQGKKVPNVSIVIMSVLRDFSILKKPKIRTQAVCLIFYCAYFCRHFANPQHSISWPMRIPQGFLTSPHQPLPSTFNNNWGSALPYHAAFLVGVWHTRPSRFPQVRGGKFLRRTEVAAVDQQNGSGAHRVNSVSPHKRIQTRDQTPPKIKARIAP